MLLISLCFHPCLCKFCLFSLNYIFCIFKVGSHPRLFLVKDEKDDLVVRKLDFVMKNPLNDKEKTTYSCSGFSVVGDCKLNIDKVCTKDRNLPTKRQWINLTSFGGN